MAEVAGLVLGGIPLAIWALEKYAEPLETFHNYRTSIETFRTNLILQNRQLQTTLSNVGLGNKPSSEDLRKCFETKFPSISRELIFIVCRMDDVTSGLMKSLDIDVSGKPNALSDKTQWEWRRVKHSFNTKKRNKVVEDLRHWNEDLRRALEKPEVLAEDNSPKVENIKRRFNIQRCSSIRQCLASFHRALEAALICTCLPPHQAAIELDWTAFDSDITQRFKVAISYGTCPQPTQSPDSWRKLHVTMDNARNISNTIPELLAPSLPPARAPFPTTSLRSKITQFKLRSLSQTLSSPLTPPDIPKPSASVPTSTSPEIANLCDAVCSECNPWTLTGTLKDLHKDQGREFSLDHNQAEPSEIIKAVSLKSLLSSHNHPTKQQTPCFSLSAKQRYRMAASITWSVLHLSGSPWLGDRWDEKQAGIFLEKCRGQEMLSWHPCSSYIFSSPITPEELPTNDFKHFIPNRAIFALGVFLIELCINKPLVETRHPNESAIPASLLEYYEAALIKLDEVYSLAGDSYGYAAERCVKFSFQGRDLYKNFDFTQFQQQFHDAVVAPVQATYLMFPDSNIPV